MDSVQEEWKNKGRGETELGEYIYKVFIHVWNVLKVTSLDLGTAGGNDFFFSGGNSTCLALL